MFPFLRPITEKDLSENLRGKPKRYRLTRNSGAVAFTGTLLTLFCHEDDPDAPLAPGASHVDTLAVFQTQGGRLLIYYVVEYPELEHISGKHEYAHVCADANELRSFLAAMAYPNKSRFADRVLAEAGPQPAAREPQAAAGS